MYTSPPEKNSSNLHESPELSGTLPKKLNSVKILKTFTHGDLSSFYCDTPSINSICSLLYMYLIILLILLHLRVRFRDMVFNATFNIISVISWPSVLLVEETGVPGENPPTCRKSLTNFIT